MLNQAAMVLERSYNPIPTCRKGRRRSSGDYTGGSAQNDQVSTEYNLRLNEMVTWTMGPHTLKFGINLPHFSRHVFEDETNRDGTYTYSPVYAQDGR